jgi:hypothetical protein
MTTKLSKEVFIISMLIICIAHFACKKEACEDCITNQPPDQPPVDTPDTSGWARLANLPAEFFFWPDNGFNTENFLLGIESDVFAISRIGNVWRYNAGANAWLPVGSIPENMVTAPATFSIYDMGYCIVNGHCWQFNPATNQWIRKKDPPASLSAPLIIGNKAYLYNYSNHLFAYEPATDAYTQQKDPPDFDNYLLGYFVINDQGYYVGANGECWKYSASLDQWQQRASFAGTDTVAKYPPSEVSFSVNNEGYILEDFNLNARTYGVPLNLWRYDAALNKWTKTKDDYYGDGFRHVKAVSLDTVAYIGLGLNREGFHAVEFWRYK